MLAEIAKNINYKGYFRRKAIEKLTNQNVLTEIMSDCEEKYQYVWTTSERYDETTWNETHSLDLRDVARKRLAELN